MSAPVKIGGHARSRIVGLAAAVTIASLAPGARADVELGAVAGAAAYASTWRGDFGGGGTLRAGARFEHVIAVDFQGWESLATVNRRMNTGLSLGVTGYLPLRAFHPYARLFGIHQHEEGLVSVANAPAGILFGIGAGIRHRAGGGLSLGAEIPLGTNANKRLEWLGFVDVTTMYFPDDTLGPHTYVGLNFGVGFDYLLK